MKHFLSEGGEWTSQSEYVEPNGKISKSQGEMIVDTNGEKIKISSLATLNGEMLSNNYIIKKISEFRYQFTSLNSALGTQLGIFDIDRNRIISKFSIKGTTLNGFEIIVREGNICQAHGALYDQQFLINTWVATMEKIEN